MKKLFILAAASAATVSMMSSCGQGSAKMTTDTDSLAYAVGIRLGHMAWELDSTVNPNILAQGVKDVYAKSAKMNDMEAGAYIQEYMTVGMARRNEAAGKKFMEEAVKNGAKTLPSGLAYTIEKPGSDRKAVQGDSILARYTLTLPNGQQVESTGDGTQLFVLEPQALIKGWLEGIPLVGEGGKIVLYVPSELAYGERGLGPIAPNQALKFDIEVVKVMPAGSAGDRQE